MSNTGLWLALALTIPLVSAGTVEGVYLAVKQDRESVGIWNLGLLRQRLAALGLDWDTAPLPSTPTNTPGPLAVAWDLGALAASDAGD